MDCGIIDAPTVETKNLWSYAFSFGSVWAFGGSFTVVVGAFVNSGQHPALVFVDAAAGQLLHF